MKIRGDTFKVKTPADSTDSDSVVIEFNNYSSDGDRELVLPSYTAKSLTWALLIFYTKKATYFALMFILMSLAISMCGPAIYR